MYPNNKNATPLIKFFLMHCEISVYYNMNTEGVNLFQAKTVFADVYLKNGDNTYGYHIFLFTYVTYIHILLTLGNLNITDANNDIQ